MNAIVEFPVLANLERLEQIDLNFEAQSGTLFWWMRPQGRPCFNGEFLEEVRRFEGSLERHEGWISHLGRAHRVQNMVFGSKVPGVFNLGGDMSMFIQAILRKDRLMLEHYGELCVQNMFRRISGFNCGIATYSLVQGKAFGGGFECALSSDVIVAERSATFSLPEVLFNMFPGMGAISLLARRVGLPKAEELVMSGQVFSAKQMREMGIVDELVDDHTGEDAVRRIINVRARRQNSYRAMAEAKRHFMPLSLDELQRIVGVWVDAAMKLETRDLRMMARLVKAQDRMLEQSSEEQAVEALYEPLRAVSNA
jgi:DSF synthase